MADYSGAPKLTVDAAFAAKFGLPAVDPQASPLVAAITPTDMADFLDNEFAALFGDAGWQADWSSASDQNIASRISTTERIETSANANEQPVRQIARAYAMISELGAGALRSDTLQVVLDRASTLLGAAISGSTEIETRLGTAEERVKAANERMTRQKDIVELRIDGLEGVDPAEAKARIDVLTAQIQMSYALTTQVLHLSILNYA